LRLLLLLLLLLLLGLGALLLLHDLVEQLALDVGLLSWVVGLLLLLLLLLLHHALVELVHHLLAVVSENGASWLLVHAGNLFVEALLLLELLARVVVVLSVEALELLLLLADQLVLDVEVVLSEHGVGLLAWVLVHQKLLVLAHLLLLQHWVTLGLGGLGSLAKHAHHLASLLVVGLLEVSGHQVVLVSLLLLVKQRLLLLVEA
jgi:hypothetical protein